MRFFPHIVPAVAINCIVISLGMTSFWLALAQGMPYFARVVTRLPQCAIMIAIQLIMIPLLVKLAQETQKTRLGLIRRNNMRIMAIDYGDAHIGIAVSDTGASICGEAWTMDERNMKRASARIASAASERGVGRIVLGLPRNMDGSLGPRAEKSMEFKKLLKADTGLEVVFWDERRTTVDAQRILHNSGKKARKQKETVDAVAAALILEGYLGSLKNI